MVDSISDWVVHFLVSHIESYLMRVWLDMVDDGKINISLNGGQVTIAQGQGTGNATQKNYD